MERELIGGSIQVASYVMGLIGVVLQRRSLIAEDDNEGFGPEKPVPEENRGCCHRLSRVPKLWLFGFCMFYSAQAIEIVALSFASQTTIVAVSSLGSLVGPIVAVKVFHESFVFFPPKSEPTIFGKIFHWDLLNLMIILAGSSCTVLFAPRVPQKEEAHFTAESLLHKWIEPPFLFYFIACLIFIPTLTFRFFKIKRGPLCLAMLLAMLNALSITTSKIVTELVERNDLFNFRAFAMIICWIGLLVSQVILFQIGLRSFEQSGAFSVCGFIGGALTICSGILYFHTYRDFKNPNYIYGFAVGVILLLYGILVFSQRKNLTRDEMRKRLMEAEREEVNGDLQRELIGNDPEIATVA